MNDATPVSGGSLGDKEGVCRDTEKEGLVVREVAVEKNLPAGNGSNANFCEGEKSMAKTDDESEGVDIDNDDDYDDDDSRSGAEDTGGSGWGLIEAGERTGYAGATVEPFAVEEGLGG